MANKEHLSILKSGVSAWNKWRSEHREIIPDLSVASLGWANLIGTDLRGADLRVANLSGADLREANLLNSVMGYTSSGGH